VVAVEMGDIVDRAVEVQRLAPFAPRVPGRRVVVAGEAHSQREQVGPFEREVESVERAHGTAGRRDLDRVSGVRSDVRHHDVDDPRLVAGVPSSAFLQRQMIGGPRAGIE
jgi:hypothetical protein